MFNVDVSDMQDDDVTFGNKAVTGTLKYLSGSNAITDVWGEGYFLCFTMAGNTWTGLEKVMVGLDPSAGSGLVDILPDNDKNGFCKITDKDRQWFVIEQTATNGKKGRQVYSLSGLTLEPKAAG